MSAVRDNNVSTVLQLLSKSTANYTIFVELQGLHPGEIAGIVIGVLIVLIILIVVGVLLIRKRNTGVATVEVRGRGNCSKSAAYEQTGEFKL